MLCCAGTISINSHHHSTPLTCILARAILPLSPPETTTATITTSAVGGNFTVQLPPITTHAVARHCHCLCLRRLHHHPPPSHYPPPPTTSPVIARGTPRVQLPRHWHHQHHHHHYHRRRRRRHDHHDQLALSSRVAIALTSILPSPPPCTASCLTHDHHAFPQFAL